MRQESGVIELHFNGHYDCTIWILNQVSFLYDVEHIADIHLAHTSFSVCILFVAAWVNYWQLTMSETDWVLIIVVRNIHPFLSIVDQ